MTAIGAAGHRAAHQVVEHGLVFADPLALPILGEDADQEDAATRKFHQRMAEQVAAGGEPFRFYVDSAELHARGGDLGFSEIQDLDRAALVGRYLPDLPAPPPGPGGHVVRMATTRSEARQPKRPPDLSD